MSIELLDKTREMNKLLHDKRSSKVAFTDICKVLGQMLDANAFVISSKGKVLGLCMSDACGNLLGIPNEQGSYIEAKLNERFLNVLSTKENVNLATLGFLGSETRGVTALITPISISAERLGTLFLCRRGEAFSIDDIIICEYSTTVVGLEMMRSASEEFSAEQSKKENVTSAMTALTPLEQKAVSCVIHDLERKSGVLVTSKIASKIGITRTVIVNALRKLESAGLIRTKSAGMKGTHIEVLNDIIYTEFDNYYREKWNS